MIDPFETNIWLPRPAEFLRSRGLVHSTVSRFELGYVLPEETGEYARFADCLTLPYQDGLRRTRSVRFRPLYPSKQKYLSKGGDPVHLFAVRAVDSPQVWLCEGEIDTMTLWQIGLPAVGIPGATTWKDEWKWLFRDCQLVTLCLDPDEAGDRSAIRVYQSLADVVSVAVAELPRGEDCNDVYVRRGEARLKKAVLV